MTAGSNARWIGLSQVSRILFQLLGLVALARLLPPSSFGVMAMATVVINLANLLRDMGTAAAIIQRPEIGQDAKSTIFWLNLGVGFVIALVVVLVAPIVSGSFHSALLTNVLWLIAIVFPITSSSAAHQALLERESSFRLIARIEISSSIIGLLVALTMAYESFGVYSLVGQTLTTAVLTSAQFWHASRWTPSFRWSQIEFRSFWHFSGHLTGFSFINFFARNADSMIIGRFLGPGALGVYSQAYKIMLFPLQNMTFVASRALFPVMSRRQAEREEIAKLYLRAVGVVSLITAPLMAGLWELREPMVRIVFGNHWIASIPLLGWLAPVGFIQSLTSSTGAVFMALGRTDQMMILGAVGAVLQVGAFLIGIHWGVEGVAACYLIANIINFFPCFFLTTKLFDRTIFDLLIIVSRQVVGALLMLLVMHLIGIFVGSRIGLLGGAALEFLVGVMVYGTLWLLWIRRFDQAALM